jgi:hypothetical protein
MRHSRLPRAQHFSNKVWTAAASNPKYPHYSLMLCLPALSSLSLHVQHSAAAAQCQQHMLQPDGCQAQTLLVYNGSMQITFKKLVTFLAMYPSAG